MAVTGRCTALRAAVHTGRTGARFTSPESRPCLGGHRPRGGGATGHTVAVPPGQLAALGLPAGTATGVAVHRTRGGGAPVAAPQAEFRLLLFTFITTFANVLTLQVFHHHVQVC